jgi:penicillin-binding protein 1C
MTPGSQQRRPALFVLIAAATVASWIALGRTREPTLVNRSGFSHAVYDRNGHLLRLTLSSDGKLRLWVPLDEIPSAMIDATLMREDSYFRWHPGVNPISRIRAAWMTYVRGGRRVGARRLRCSSRVSASESTRARLAASLSRSPSRSI